MKIVAWVAASPGTLATMYQPNAGVYCETSGRVVGVGTIPGYPEHAVALRDSGEIDDETYSGTEFNPTIHRIVE